MEKRKHILNQCMGVSKANPVPKGKHDSNFKLKYVMSRKALMAFLFASRLGFRHFFNGHPFTGSHIIQPYFTRSSRSGLLAWPTKITPTVHNLKTALINKPRPSSLSIAKSIALAGLGVGFATWNKPAIRCDGMCLMTGYHIKASACN